jgi:poly(3-hydroxyalkanoate) depolymerase
MSARVRPSHPIEHADLHIGGDRLHLAMSRPERAEGSPLLIFNGIGASAQILEPLMHGLDRIRTLTFDLPGIGASPLSPLLRRLPGFARLACEVLDAFDIPRAHVMGISWGGGLAQQFAMQHPDRVDRLVLAATSTGHLMVPGSPAVWMRMATPLRYLSAGYLRRVAGDLYGGDFRHDPHARERLVRRMAPPSLLGYLNQLYALAGWTSLHWLHRLRQPTLVLAGSDDPIVPLVNARILAARIPGAELEVLDCGHLFILTRLPRTVELIERFLLQSGTHPAETRDG